MTNTFTLDDIREAADKKYGSVFIPLSDGTQVELVNALRLSKEKRALLRNQEPEDEEGDEDTMAERLEEILVTVARTPYQGKRLVEECGGDMAMLVTILDFYRNGTQLGEASPSQS